MAVELKSRRMRNLVCQTAKDRPSLSDWIERISALDPCLAQAVEGIWCGESGSTYLDVPGLPDNLLVVQWYNKRVEVCYLS